MENNKFFELYLIKDYAPKLIGLPTGTKLDQMFFTFEKSNGKFQKKPIGGIPNQSIINLTGIPDTGKSLLVEQFAVVQANSGNKVLFVTVESPAYFLTNSVKIKCDYLNFDFNKVAKNIVIIDASANSELRENPKALIDTMAEAIKSKKIKVVVIDSITGLYEHKEIMARGIVRMFYNFLKKFQQTGLIVSQKRSAQRAESSEAAGGLAVAHIVDGTIVIDKKLIENNWDAKLYKLPIGSVLRTIRIDGCRLCAHDQQTWVFNISPAGTIEITTPLSEFIKSENS